jgi:hypothetical protein
MEILSQTKMLKQEEGKSESTFLKPAPHPALVLGSPDFRKL